jgi:ABC-type amino acid transport substrate-binding protein
MPLVQRIWRNFGAIGLILALLFGVTLLPPDTSLDEVQRAGALRACVPAAYPPLVTGDPEMPGIDVEILRDIAQRMGVSLVLSENRAMGRDFNPRNWNLNRAQCQVVAGGVVDSNQTRSFLETGPSYAETGWAIISPQPLASVGGLDLGTLAIVSGFDRIGLSSFLRAEGAAARVVTSAEALVAGISDGTLDAGVTEALLATRIADEQGWTVQWVAPTLPRYNLVLGLWKGDITLKRAIESAFAGLETDGTLSAILDRYGVRPID